MMSLVSGCKTEQSCQKIWGYENHEGGIVAFGVLEWLTACLGKHDTHFAFIAPHGCGWQKAGMEYRIASIGYRRTIELRNLLCTIQL